jgi:hypothetical protein
MRKSDFIGSDPIAQHNDAGIIVTKVEQTFNVAVEIDQDTVVQVDSTSADRVDNVVNQLIPEVDSFKDRFKNCFPD